MRKEEFLQTLRRALTGDVPPGVVEENIRYYDGYISEEVRKGRSEEEVIKEIGDPRLIARTIEDTTDGGGNVYQSGAYEYGENGGGYGESSYGGSFRVFRLDKWYWKLLLALLVFGVIYLVLAIIGGILALLAPVIVPLALIWIILSVVRNMRR